MIRQEQNTRAMRRASVHYAETITPCSLLTRPKTILPAETAGFNKQARSVLLWTERVSSYVLAEAERKDGDFSRKRIVADLLTFQDELKANTNVHQNSYAKRTLERTLVKLQEYVATRPLPYVITWLSDFAHRMSALGIVCAYEIEGKSTPPEIVQNAFVVDAKRSCLISDRDFLLYSLRGCYQTAFRNGAAIAPAVFKEEVLFLLRELVAVPEFKDLPSTKWARALSRYFTLVDDPEQLRDTMKDFLDLFRYEARIIRKSVPSNLWGSKRKDISPEMELAPDSDSTKTKKNLLWTRCQPDRDDKLSAVLSEHANAVYDAYDYLFTNERIQPVISFEMLPLELKKELLRIGLQSRATAERTKDAVPSIRNPDKTVEDLEALENDGWYRTLAIPLSQTLLMAWQVQFSRDAIMSGENSSKILDLAYESTRSLKDKYPVYVRLTIIDPHDRAEGATLGVKLYEQLLDATFDRAIVLSKEPDPRKLFLFGIVRKGNRALDSHLKRGWRLSGKTFTLVRKAGDPRPSVDYDIIIHDPQ